MQRADYGNGRLPGLHHATAASRFLGGHASRATTVLKLRNFTTDAPKPATRRAPSELNHAVNRLTSKDVPTTVVDGDRNYLPPSDRGFSRLKSLLRKKLHTRRLEGAFAATDGTKHLVVLDFCRVFHWVFGQHDELGQFTWCD